MQTEFEGMLGVDNVEIIILTLPADLCEGLIWPEQHAVKLVWPNNVICQLRDGKGSTQEVVTYVLLVVKVLVTKIKIFDIGA